MGEFIHKSSIETWENELVESIKKIMPANCLVTADVPLDENPNEYITRNAAKTAEGAVFIGYLGGEFGEPDGISRVYSPMEYFLIAIFSKSRRGPNDTYRYYEAVLPVVYGMQYKLINRQSVPTKGKKGTYRFNFIIGKSTTYPY